MLNDLKIPSLLLSFIALSGCAGSPVHTSSLSPYQLSQIDNYTLCKGATPREAYYPSQSVLNEVRRRGLNCASIYIYSGTGELDAAAAALGSMSQRRQPNLPNTPSTVSCTRMGDASRQVFTFRGIACPVGYAPAF